jgi:hypothetical protein
MSKVITKYGLRVKGTEDILKYDSYYSHDENSVGYIYSFSKSGDSEWLVGTIDLALNAMFNPPPEYNASYETPKHYYKPEDLEVVKVEQIINEEPIEFKFVKIKLNNTERDTIPYYEDKSKTKHGKDTSYMINKIGIAIDKGDYYQIVKMNGVMTNIIESCKFDKKYFDIIED